MACSREPARFLILTAVAWFCSGCAGLLGLDQGVPEIEGGSEAPGDTTAPSDGIDGGAAKADAAAPAIDAASPGNDASAAPEAGDSGSPPPSPDTGAPPPDTGSACMLTLCAGGCYDTASDPRHCGDCATVCAHGSNSKPVCVDGACSQVCDPGYVDCGGHACSCGAGNRCLSDGTCGTCRATLQACQTGTDCCSGTCALTLTCS